MQQYALIDSGQGQKLEDFGGHKIVRPCAQAVWSRTCEAKEWDLAEAVFSREESNCWHKKDLPEEWSMDVDGMIFKLSPTNFGHLGIFPEQRNLWKKIRRAAKQFHKPMKVLNLFAYSGGSTLAAALEGCHVTHLDASKGMVDWARQNAALNGLDKAPIRWIVDDVRKFLKRELKRQNEYDAIILDPPSFGRGAKGEMFKIEYELEGILENCRSLLTDDPAFLLLSCHTPGYTPIVLNNILDQVLDKGNIEAGEMVLGGEKRTYDVPGGTFAWWEPL